MNTKQIIIFILMIFGIILLNSIDSDGINEFYNKLLKIFLSGIFVAIVNLSFYNIKKTLENKISKLLVIIRITSNICFSLILFLYFFDIDYSNKIVSILNLLIFISSLMVMMKGIDDWKARK